MVSGEPPPLIPGPTTPPRGVGGLLVEVVVLSGGLLASTSCLMGMAVVFVMNLGWVTQMNALPPAKLLFTLGSSLLEVLGMVLFAQTLVVLRSRPGFAVPRTNSSKRSSEALIGGATLTLAAGLAALSFVEVLRLTQTELVDHDAYFRVIVTGLYPLLVLQLGAVFAWRVLRARRVARHITATS